VIPNKINTAHTYLATTNYWARLHEAEEDDSTDQTNTIPTAQTIKNTTSNNRTRRIEQRQTMKLVIDSGATSYFFPEELDLPKKGKSDKEVFLPDNSSLQASYKTELPFEQLSNKAREADILPGLKTPLISVKKLAEEGYTTIFHPGEEGVTIHKKDTITIATTEPPVLQVSKSRGVKLWTTSAQYKTKKERAKEQANNAYDLPSIKQTVRYLHAAAGFPVKDTWIKAIEAGNFNTWPTITPKTVQRYFPESDETQKGHMKK
jgi:hypothetical protein